MAEWHKAKIARGSVSDASKNDCESADEVVEPEESARALAEVFSENGSIIDEDESKSVVPIMFSFRKRNYSVNWVPYLMMVVTSLVIVVVPLIIYLTGFSSWNAASPILTVSPASEVFTDELDVSSENMVQDRGTTSASEVVNTVIQREVVVLSDDVADEDQVAKISTSNGVERFSLSVDSLSQLAGDTKKGSTSSTVSSPTPLKIVSAFDDTTAPLSTLHPTETGAPRSFHPTELSIIQFFTEQKISPLPQELLERHSRQEIRDRDWHDYVDRILEKLSSWDTAELQAKLMEKDDHAKSEEINEPEKSDNSSRSKNNDKNSDKNEQVLNKQTTLGEHQTDERTPRARPSRGTFLELGHQKMAEMKTRRSRMSTTHTRSKSSIFSSHNKNGDEDFPEDDTLFDDDGNLQTANVKRQRRAFYKIFPPMPSCDPDLINVARKYEKQQHGYHFWKKDTKDTTRRQQPVWNMWLRKDEPYTLRSKDGSELYNYDGNFHRREGLLSSLAHRFSPRWKKDQHAGEDDDSTTSASEGIKDNSKFIYLHDQACFAEEQKAWLTVLGHINAEEAIPKEKFDAISEEFQLTKFGGRPDETPMKSLEEIRSLWTTIKVLQMVQRRLETSGIVMIHPDPITGEVTYRPKAKERYTILPVILDEWRKTVDFQGTPVGSNREDDLQGKNGDDLADVLGRSEMSDSSLNSDTSFNPSTWRTPELLFRERYSDSKGIALLQKLWIDEAIRQKKLNGKCFLVLGKRNAWRVPEKTYHPKDNKFTLIEEIPESEMRDSVNQEVAVALFLDYQTKEIYVLQGDPSGFHFEKDEGVNYYNEAEFLSPRSNAVHEEVQRKYIMMEDNRSEQDSSSSFSSRDDEEDIFNDRAFSRDSANDNDGIEIVTGATGPGHKWIVPLLSAMVPPGMLCPYSYENSDGDFEPKLGDVRCMGFKITALIEFIDEASHAGQEHEHSHKNIEEHLYGCNLFLNFPSCRPVRLPPMDSADRQKRWLNMRASRQFYSDPVRKTETSASTGSADQTTRGEVAMEGLFGVGTSVYMIANLHDYQTSDLFFSDNGFFSDNNAFQAFEGLDINPNIDFNGDFWSIVHSLVHYVDDWKNGIFNLLSQWTGSSLIDKEGQAITPLDPGNPVLGDVAGAVLNTAYVLQRYQQMKRSRQMLLKFSRLLSAMDHWEGEEEEEAERRKEKLKEHQHALMKNKKHNSGTRSSPRKNTRLKSSEILSPKKMKNPNKKSNEELCTRFDRHTQISMNTLDKAAELLCFWRHPVNANSYEWQDFYDDMLNTDITLHHVADSTIDGTDSSTSGTGLIKSKDKNGEEELWKRKKSPRERTTKAKLETEEDEQFEKRAYKVHRHEFEGRARLTATRPQRVCGYKSPSELYDADMEEKKKIEGSEEDDEGASQAASSSPNRDANAKDSSGGPSPNTKQNYEINELLSIMILLSLSAQSVSNNSENNQVIITRGDLCHLIYESFLPPLQFLGLLPNKPEDFDKKTGIRYFLAEFMRPTCQGILTKELRTFLEDEDSKNEKDGKNGDNTHTPTTEAKIQNEFEHLLRHAQDHQKRFATRKNKENHDLEELEAELSTHVPVILRKKDKLKKKLSTSDKHAAEEIIEQLWTEGLIQTLNKHLLEPLGFELRFKPRLAVFKEGFGGKLLGSAKERINKEIRKKKRDMKERIGMVKKRDMKIDVGFGTSAKSSRIAKNTRSPLGGGKSSFLEKMLFGSKVKRTSSSSTNLFQDVDLPRPYILVLKDQDKFVMQLYEKVWLATGNYNYAGGLCPDDDHHNDADRLLKMLKQRQRHPQFCRALGHIACRFVPLPERTVRALHVILKAHTAPITALERLSNTYNQFEYDHLWGATKRAILVPGSIKFILIPILGLSDAARAFSNHFSVKFHGERARAVQARIGKAMNIIRWSLIADEDQENSSQATSDSEEDKANGIKQRALKIQDSDGFQARFERFQSDAFKDRKVREDSDYEWEKENKEIGFGTCKNYFGKIPHKIGEEFIAQLAMYSNVETDNLLWLQTEEKYLMYIHLMSGVLAGPANLFGGPIGNILRFGIKVTMKTILLTYTRIGRLKNPFTWFFRAMKQFLKDARHGQFDMSAFQTTLGCSVKRLWERVSDIYKEDIWAAVEDNDRIGCAASLANVLFDLEKEDFEALSEFSLVQKGVFVPSVAIPYKPVVTLSKLTEEDTYKKLGFGKKLGRKLFNNKIGMKLLGEDFVRQSFHLNHLPGSSGYKYKGGYLGFETMAIQSQSHYWHDYVENSKEVCRTSSHLLEKPLPRNYLLITKFLAPPTPIQIWNDGNPNEKVALFDLITQVEGKRPIWCYIPDGCGSCSGLKTCGKNTGGNDDNHGDEDSSSTSFIEKTLTSTKEKDYIRTKDPISLLQLFQHTRRSRTSAKEQMSRQKERMNPLYEFSPRAAKARAKIQKDLLHMKQQAHNSVRNHFKQRTNSIWEALKHPKEKANAIWTQMRNPSLWGKSKQEQEEESLEEKMSLSARERRQEELNDHLAHGLLLRKDVSHSEFSSCLNDYGPKAYLWNHIQAADEKDSMKRVSIKLVKGFEESTSSMFSSGGTSYCYPGVGTRLPSGQLLTEDAGKAYTAVLGKIKNMKDNADQEYAETYANYESNKKHVLEVLEQRKKDMDKKLQDSLVKIEGFRAGKNLKNLVSQSLSAREKVDTSDGNIKKSNDAPQANKKNTEDNKKKHRHDPNLYAKESRIHHEIQTGCFDLYSLGLLRPILFSVSPEEKELMNEEQKSSSDAKSSFFEYGTSDQDQGRDQDQEKDSGSSEGDETANVDPPEVQENINFFAKEAVPIFSRVSQKYGPVERAMSLLHKVREKFEILGEIIRQKNWYRISKDPTASVGRVPFCEMKCILENGGRCKGYETITRRDREVDCVLFEETQPGVIEKTSDAEIAASRCGSAECESEANEYMRKGMFHDDPLRAPYAFQSLGRWSPCAKEYGNCLCESGIVRFGSLSEGMWIEKEFHTLQDEVLDKNAQKQKFSCTVRTFEDDPLPGIRKTCECYTPGHERMRYEIERKADFHESRCIIARQCFLVVDPHAATAYEIKDSSVKDKAEMLKRDFAHDREEEEEEIERKIFREYTWRNVLQLAVILVGMMGIFYLCIICCLRKNKKFLKKVQDRVRRRIFNRKKRNKRNKNKRNNWENWEKYGEDWNGEDWYDAEEKWDYDAEDWDDNDAEKFQAGKITSNDKTAKRTTKGAAGDTSTILTEQHHLKMSADENLLKYTTEDMDTTFRPPTIDAHPSLQQIPRGTVSRKSATIETHMQDRARKKKKNKDSGVSVNNDGQEDLVSVNHDDRRSGISVKDARQAGAAISINNVNTATLEVLDATRTRDSSGVKNVNDTPVAARTSKHLHAPLISTIVKNVKKRGSGRSTRVSNLRDQYEDRIQRSVSPVISRSVSPARSEVSQTSRLTRITGEVTSPRRTASPAGEPLLSPSPLVERHSGLRLSGEQHASKNHHEGATHYVPHEMDRQNRQQGNVLTLYPLPPNHDRRSAGSSQR